MAISSKMFRKQFQFHLKQALVIMKLYNSLVLNFNHFEIDLFIISSFIYSWKNHHFVTCNTKPLLFRYFQDESYQFILMWFYWGGYFISNHSSWCVYLSNHLLSRTACKYRLHWSLLCQIPCNFTSFCQNNK